MIEMEQYSMIFWTTVFLSLYCECGTQHIQEIHGLVNNGNIVVNFPPIFSVSITPSNYISCGWTIDSFTQEFFGRPCDNPPPQRCCALPSQLPTHVTCSNNDTVATSTISLPALNKLGNFTVKLICSPQNFNTFFLSANYCPYRVSNIGPTISSVNFTYNSPGQFVCPGGQELFYSNSTPGITNTICQSHAAWFGSSGLECWADPQPTITGKFSGIEGTTITVNCHPLNMVYPPVTGYNFVIGGTQTKNQTSSSHTFMLSRNLNAQQVYCQANTKYTQMNNTLGKSSFQTLNVTYPPTISGIRANGLLIQYANQYVLLQNTSITLTCDVDSNPNSICSWSYESFIESGDSCSVTRKFNISTNTTCTAYNGVGEPATKSVTIISVPVKRQPKIYVNGQTIINNATQPLNLSSNLNLSCSVDYEKYLNTSFNWMKGDVTVSKTNKFSINNATQNNTGYYVCKSSDEFGKFQSRVNVNVQYIPFGMSGMNCFQHQQCVIVVSSNPPPSNPVLLSPGNTSELLTWENISHPFYTTIINKPHGEYFLKVTNSVGESSLKITVQSSASTPTSSNVPMIIGLSVTGVVVILLIVLALFMFWKRRKDPQASTGKAPQEAPVYMNASLYENTGAIAATPTYQNTAEYQNVASEKITTKPESTTAYETFGTN